VSLTFFIAGIIQGSLADGMHDQDYRARIAEVIRRRFPDARIVDPVALNPNSLEYSDDEARETFFAMIEEARAADVVIAFVPSCSMGTAVEMWEARRAGKPVIAISPLTRNWAVRYLSTREVGSIDELDTALAEVVGR
jgi:nucleoside 2-deoxyribosyltransferase